MSAARKKKGGAKQRKRTATASPEARAAAPDPVEAEAPAPPPAGSAEPPREARAAGSELEEKPRPGLVPSWPDLVLRELTLILALSALLLLLAMLVEAPLGPLAAPTEPDNPEKAPWYFVGVQEMVSYSASSGVLLFPGALLIGLLLIPMLERRGPRTGRWFADSGPGLALLAALAGGVASVLGLWLWEAGRLVGSGLDPARLLLLTAALLAGLAAWRRRRPHAAGVVLVISCLAGYGVFTLVGLLCRGPSWAFFWPWQAWPGGGA